MYQLIIWGRQIIYCAPITYSSGGLHLSPTLLGARLAYASYINLVVAGALDVP